MELKKRVNDKSEFQKILDKNTKEVKNWPKWKREIKITSKTASTGDFIQED